MDKSSFQAMARGLGMPLKTFETGKRGPALGPGPGFPVPEVLGYPPAFKALSKT